MNNLLLEIGTEEIPAGYIEPALNALSSTLQKKLTHARIEHGNARVFGTPKRLAVEIADVSDKQTAVTNEMVGPPEKVGFDAQGKPTVAAEKFAEKVGVAVNEIQVKETPKGRYLCAEKTEHGGATASLLETLLPEIITGIPFPKTMKWGDLNVYFARPMHSILAMLGNTVIPFSLGNIQSGNTTAGHRFMKPEILTVSQPDAYADILRNAHVLANPAERKQLLEQEISKVAKELGGNVLPDIELVDIVNNLVEYPVAVAGRFDKEFLEVPDEVLINAMREHQKYFAIIDENGKLMPCFIAVNNTRARDMALVGKGHERVLRARLADAQFFYKSDLEVSSETRLEKLKGVLFQKILGSMYEKTLRIQKLGEFLTDKAGKDDTLKKQVSRAALLCKTDLVSQVVVEFPKLQGVMGRVYASVAGEDPETATAVEEHYRPTYSRGQLPESLAGAMVAMADKTDSICGCFSVGLIPSGASDPYALRRQAIGIIQIMLKNNLSFSLKEMIAQSANLFAEKSTRSINETIEAVYTFFQNRMAHLLAEEGFSKDVIAAVIEVSVEYVPDVWNRVRALENLKAKPDFEPLAVAFKRVVNIIRKAGETGEGMGEVNKSLFEHESESALSAAYETVRQNVMKNMAEARFDQALLDIASLRNTVDAFFDGVLVMAEDAAIRNNRLALLRDIAGLFENFADFSRIST